MGMGVWVSLSESILTFARWNAQVRPLCTEFFLIVTSLGVKAEDEKPWVPMAKALKVQSTTSVLQRMVDPKIEGGTLIK
jgi:hypothetical protein